MTTTTPAAPARRRLILHAGTHKTASTDIQSRLLRSRALLEQQNVRYRFPLSASGALVEGENVLTVK